MPTIIGAEVAKMHKKKVNQSDYMSLQLMEIENFRMSLSYEGQAIISFQEATMLWFSEGRADKFKADYPMMRETMKPATA